MLNDLRGGRWQFLYLSQTPSLGRQQAIMVPRSLGTTHIYTGARLEADSEFISAGSDISRLRCPECLQQHHLCLFLYDEVSYCRYGTLTVRVLFGDVQCRFIHPTRFAPCHLQPRRVDRCKEALVAASPSIPLHDTASVETKYMAQFRSGLICWR